MEPMLRSMNLAKEYPVGDAPNPAGLYSPIIALGQTAYLSGMLPLENGVLKYSGSVPSQVSVLDATEAAALCAANLIRVMRRDLGPLEKVQRIVKLAGFVYSDAGFHDQHLVINGASKLILDVFGDAGHPARSAVGMISLPLAASVEIELIIEI